VSTLFDRLDLGSVSPLEFGSRARDEPVRLDARAHLSVCCEFRRLAAKYSKRWTAGGGFPRTFGCAHAWVAAANFCI
jgi:hypothetical protein